MQIDGAVSDTSKNGFVKESYDEAFRQRDVSLDFMSAMSAMRLSHICNFRISRQSEFRKRHQSVHFGGIVLLKYHVIHFSSFKITDLQIELYL